MGKILPKTPSLRLCVIRPNQRRQVTKHSTMAKCIQTSKNQLSAALLPTIRDVWEGSHKDTKSQRIQQW